MRRLRRRRSRQEEWQDESTNLDDDQVLSALDQLPDEDLYGDYEDAPIEPFVPVEDDDDQDYEYFDDTSPEAASPARASRRRVWPRLRPRSSGTGLALRWDHLLLVLVLIGGGIFFTLLNQNRLQAQIEEWWPLAVVVVAALWMIIALARRQVASFLGGAVLAGVGLSLLMNNQDIARFKETVLGMVLVTAGLGIVIRGFVLRQRTPLS
jgi:hypothetical protein